MLTIFSPSLVRHLHNPLFAVPLQPASFHDDVPHADEILTPGDHGFYAAFSGASRSDASKGTDRAGWLGGFDECAAQRGRTAKRGPTPEDVAWAQGYSTAMEAGYSVEAPDTLDDVEWAAFVDGVGAALGELQGMREYDRHSF